MSENRCNHGEHHSYCVECLAGPQPNPGAIIGVIVKRALDMAPLLAGATDDAPTSIDIELSSIEDASFARDEINRAIKETEWADVVSAWVWAGSSGGNAQTAAGRATGYELRLQRHRT